MVDGVRVPVIVDCDPGIDDAIALLLAFASPELDILGVSAVAGNVSVERARENLVRLCDLAGAPTGVPVLYGAVGPIARRARVADEPMHGPGGLGGVELPPSGRTAQPDAVGWMAERLRERPGEITLVALGPLTNVAALLHRHPELGAASRQGAPIKEIVVMGGAAFAQGNVTPAAEFNFHADPEAARYVLESGVPIRVVGLDVTRRALTPAADIRALAEMPSRVTRAAATMLGHLAERFEARHGIAACAIHDALAVAAVIRPGLLRWTPATATVECAGEFTRGALVADVRQGAAEGSSTRIATEVDKTAFGEFLLARLGSYATAADPTP